MRMNNELRVRICCALLKIQKFGPFSNKLKKYWVLEDNEGNGSDREKHVSSSFILLRYNFIIGYFYHAFNHRW